MAIAVEPTILNYLWENKIGFIDDIYIHAYICLFYYYRNLACPFLIHLCMTNKYASRLVYCFMLKPSANQVDVHFIPYISICFVWSQVRQLEILWDLIIIWL